MSTLSFEGFDNKNESGTYTGSAISKSTAINAAEIISVSTGNYTVTTPVTPVAETPQSDAINPSHYGFTPGVDNPYEVIKIIEHFNLDFCTANILKYLLRSGKKAGNPPIQDHKKALWYLNRRIKQLEDAEKTEQV
jgi:hypothetical protein